MWLYSSVVLNKDTFCEFPPYSTAAMDTIDCFALPVVYCYNSKTHSPDKAETLTAHLFFSPHNKEIIVRKMQVFCSVGHTL